MRRPRNLKPRLLLTASRSRNTAAAELAAAEHADASRKKRRRQPFLRRRSVEEMAGCIGGGISAG
jgi:hypothetical protein